MICPNKKPAQPIGVAGGSGAVSSWRRGSVCLPLLGHKDWILVVLAEHFVEKCGELVGPFRIS